MKKLILLNGNTDIKLNDTGTIIQFKAQNDGQPVSISNGQTATFRIKNDFGFVKSVKASSSYGGYVFELDTADLSGLVVGSYQVELLIQKDADDALIFPDTAFVGFNITANALTITGEQLPMMSLDQFKNELKTYVDNQTASAETTIKNDFNSYVESIPNNVLTTSTNALNTANSAKSTADSAKSTADSAINKANANASLITSLSESVNLWNNTTNLMKLVNQNPSLDFNQIKNGIINIDGWNSVQNSVTNFPEFLKDQGSIMIALNGPYYIHQIVFDENGNIYHRIIRNTTYYVKMDWKKIAYQS